ncbi:MAG: hypothetical protein J6S91_05155 [Treponema sp.]|nr:hypothetical protein [Treponema sp.]
MYTVKDNLIFGFHGCDELLCNKLVNGDLHLDYSDNPYDWLGKGMYFWENDPERALLWAENSKKHPQNKKQVIKKPAVVGAVICLGKCLDFMEISNIQKLKAIYDELTALGIDLPENTGRDFYKRNLDCFLINSLIAQEKTKGNVYDSVRGVFFEGSELYKNAGFREKNHIQISEINPNCIKGYFKVRQSDKTFAEV